MLINTQTRNVLKDKDRPWGKGRERVNHRVSRGSAWGLLQAQAHSDTPPITAVSELPSVHSGNRCGLSEPLGVLWELTGSTY